MTDPLATASTLLDRGLALFDLPAGGRRPAPGWTRRATTDREQVAAWVRAGHNLAVGCRASGVVGIDLDRHGDAPDGVAVFGALCARLGLGWPHTLIARTPRRGLHVYFRAPAGRIIASTSGGRSGLGPGIDTRGPGRRGGGYLVAPGSTVPAGGYAIEHDAVIAELPAALATLLTRPCFPGGT